MKPAAITAAHAGADLLVGLAGDWKVQGARADASAALAALEAQAGGALRFETAGLGDWDSTLLVFLLRLEQRCAARKIDFRCETLPASIAGLIALSRAVPEKQTGRLDAAPASPVARLGTGALGGWTGAAEVAGIVGASVLSLGRVLRGQGAFNWRDFRVTLYESSVGALPIVGLISFLTGLILAFVGSMQLAKFGATIYVANLVALGMVREMGALMTAIIMAGRTGAAFAAQIGSMKVNEEIDALNTLAISPQDFLITPRLLALFIMMPLLCLYADLIGMAGGASVALGLMNLSWAQYLTQTHKAMDLIDVGTGLFKSVVFGGIVALAGCLRGMQCGTNAAAVGVAATSAVVTGITLIVASDAVFDVLFNLLKI